MIISWLRSFRVMGIAMFDVVAGILGLFLVFRSLHFQHPLALGALTVFPIAILAHWLFGIPTMLNYYLGISAQPTRG